MQCKRAIYICICIEIINVHVCACVCVSSEHQWNVWVTCLCLHCNLQKDTLGQYILGHRKHHWGHSGTRHRYFYIFKINQAYGLSSICTRFQTNSRITGSYDLALKVWGKFDSNSCSVCVGDAVKEWLGRHSNSGKFHKPSDAQMRRLKLSTSWMKWDTKTQTKIPRKGQ